MTPLTPTHPPTPPPTPDRVRLVYLVLLAVYLPHCSAPGLGEKSTCFNSDKLPTEPSGKQSRPWLNPKPESRFSSTEPSGKQSKPWLNPKPESRFSSGSVPWTRHGPVRRFKREYLKASVFTYTPPLPPALVSPRFPPHNIPVFQSSKSSNYFQRNCLFPFGCGNDTVVRNGISDVNKNAKFSFSTGSGSAENLTISSSKTPAFPLTASTTQQLFKSRIGTGRGSTEQFKKEPPSSTTASTTTFTFDRPVHWLRSSTSQQRQKSEAWNRPWKLYSSSNCQQP